MTSRSRYTVAFLAGHGVGPEVTAEATRAIGAAARLHGFHVEERHVPYGADAFTRFGHPYPISSRKAVVDADAVLVAAGTDPLDLEVELDLRASASRVRCEDAELTLLSPSAEDAWEWTLERAVALARASRARLTLVGVTETWAAHAALVEADRDGLEVERLPTAEAMRSLVFTPHRFDVLVCPPELALAAAEVAACTASRRVTAWGRLAANGPSVFGAGLDPREEVAGHGVADPKPMLLAAALLLGEGLGERRAAATLSAAVGRAAAPGSTRGVADTVLAALPQALEVEFLREAV
jgi:isocitrate/isopropylmalate dehydrogenase